MLERVASRKMTVTFSEEQLVALRTFYAPGNRELQEETGLDLAAKGYPV